MPPSCTFLLVRTEGQVTAVSAESFPILQRWFIETSGFKLSDKVFYFKEKLLIFFFSPF